MIRAFHFLALGAFLWEGSAYVGVATVLLLGVVDDEDNVVVGFECGDDGLVVGLVGDWLFVDLGDDGALDEVDLVGEGAGHGRW